MTPFMPKTASAQQVQKQYRTLFNDVMQSKEPILILNKNHPEVVIIDVTTYENLLENARHYEEEMAKKAIASYEKEKKNKKLKKLNSLADLMS